MLDLDAIRRRLPAVPREDMSRHEEDRADLLAEVDRLATQIATVRRLAVMWQNSILVPRQDCGDDLLDALGDDDA